MEKLPHPIYLEILSKWINVVDVSHFQCTSRKVSFAPSMIFTYGNMAVVKSQTKLVRIQDWLARNNVFLDRILVEEFVFDFSKKKGNSKGGGKSHKSASGNGNWRVHELELIMPFTGFITALSDAFDFSQHLKRVVVDQSSFCGRDENIEHSDLYLSGFLMEFPIRYKAYFMYDYGSYYFDYIIRNFPKLYRLDMLVENFVTTDQVYTYDFNEERELVPPEEADLEDEPPQPYECSDAPPIHSIRKVLRRFEIGKLECMHSVVDNITDRYFDIVSEYCSESLTELRLYATNTRNNYFTYGKNYATMEGIKGLLEKFRKLRILDLVGFESITDEVVAVFLQQSEIVEEIHLRSFEDRPESDAVVLSNPALWIPLAAKHASLKTITVGGLSFQFRCPGQVPCQLFIARPMSYGEHTHSDVCSPACFDTYLKLLATHGLAVRRLYVYVGLTEEHWSSVVTYAHSSLSLVEYMPGRRDRYYRKYCEMSAATYNLLTTRCLKLRHLVTQMLTNPDPTAVAAFLLKGGGQTEKQLKSFRWGRGFVHFETGDGVVTGFTVGYPECVSVVQPILENFSSVDALTISNATGGYPKAAPCGAPLTAFVKFLFARFGATVKSVRLCHVAAFEDGWTIAINTCAQLDSLILESVSTEKAFAPGWLQKLTDNSANRCWKQLVLLGLESDDVAVDILEAIINHAETLERASLNDKMPPKALALFFKVFGKCLQSFKLHRTNEYELPEKAWKEVRKAKAANAAMQVELVPPPDENAIDPHEKEIADYYM